MIPLSWVVLLLTLIGAPLILIVLLKGRVKDKALCLILEEDKTLTIRLLPRKGDFVVWDKDVYLIDEEYARTTWYPGNFPTFLQNQVPVLLLQNGRAEPLDWLELNKRGMNPNELGEVLDSHWMGNLIHHTKEGAVQAKTSMWTWIGLGVGVVSLLVLFYLLTKIGALESAVSGIENLLK